MVVVENVRVVHLLVIHHALIYVEIVVLEDV